MKSHLLPLLFIVVLSVGCKSKEEIASVEGTVTMDGKPLEGATVVFINTSGRPAGASTDAAGHYVLNFTKGRQGAIPGPNKVRISTIRDAGVDADGKPVPAQKERVPMRYNAQTTLEFEVKPGEKNIANFDLESKGPIVQSSSY